jgi:hypothetical protein
VWLGASTTDGTSFVWVDGTSVDNPPWGASEPNSGPSSCVAIDEYQAFNDGGCVVDPKRALCERDE